MNNSDFTYLLQNPESIDNQQTTMLTEILNEFPYFQAARTIQLKGFHKNNDFKYNKALKITAAYTVDRKVLFDFITSFSFNNISSKNYQVLEEIEVIEPKTVEVLHKKLVDKFSFTTKKTTEETKATKILEIGKPISFKSSEPHSFNEWMQLISKNPILREKSKPENSPNDHPKFKLIDQFIETNPKINPIDKNIPNKDISLESLSEDKSIMTETLAKVYLEQKKYENAIKAYRILILKYPEKSGFFADRIKAIKILQKNKS
ncbi:tetratricopeptide repeat protein [uncultured Lutibacter sp.]|uniref:tetratricopeptide repeat protein n=1 Tax=uncultured Lutibacter sp. TaxID=437739 RepID=UPI002625A19C|nr:tetratricopeptide repeat protein [uncultured Lutibacter sp.]